MRRLIAQEFVTIDGLAAAPKGDVEAKSSDRGATLLRYRPR